MAQISNSSLKTVPSPDLHLETPAECITHTLSEHQPHDWRGAVQERQRMRILIVVLQMMRLIRPLGLEITIISLSRVSRKNLIREPAILPSRLVPRGGVSYSQLLINEGQLI